MAKDPLELSLSKRLLDEMTLRVRQLSEEVSSHPFEPEADNANTERQRLWKVIEYAKDELRQCYEIEYVPSSFEGQSFFYHKNSYHRFCP